MSAHSESPPISVPVTKVLTPVASQNPNKKKYCFVTSEIADLGETGAWATLSAALPRAMSHLHDVRVLIPGYPQVLHSENPIHIIGEFGGHAALPPCKIGRMDMPDGLVIYVLICPELYEREGSPYGANNGSRLAGQPHSLRPPRPGGRRYRRQPGTNSLVSDLVHAHDWPAGLAPAYMHWRGQRTPTLFTIHNLAYQGVTSLGSCPELGIPHHALQQEGMEFYGSDVVPQGRPIRATSPPSARPTPRKSPRRPSARSRRFPRRQNPARPAQRHSQRHR